MRATPRRRGGGYRAWAGLAVAAMVPSCLHARPLTRREATIPVIAYTPETAEALRKDCKVVGDVAPISNPSEAEADAQRIAGERQTQVAVKVMELTGARVFNCQFWRCPGARADKAGYLAWQRGTGVFDKGLRLVQDGKVVDDGTFDGLAGLVAREPAAVEHAERAASKMKHATTMAGISVGLLSVALAGAGAAMYGSIKQKTPLLLGGLGVTIVFTSVGWGFAAAAGNAAAEGTTEAMEAVDLHNGDYPGIGGRTLP